VTITVTTQSTERHEYINDFYLLGILLTMVLYLNFNLIVFTLLFILLFFGDEFFVRMEEDCL